jgi:hypothetical protein
MHVGARSEWPRHSLVHRGAFTFFRRARVGRRAAAAFCTAPTPRYTALLPQVQQRAGWPGNRGTLPCRAGSGDAGRRLSAAAEQLGRRAGPQAAGQDRPPCAGVCGEARWRSGRRGGGGGRGAQRRRCDGGRHLRRACAGPSGRAASAAHRSAACACRCAVCVALGACAAAGKRRRGLRREWRSATAATAADRGPSGRVLTCRGGV